jgi:rfaE bifunctional protein nucleotidyltransferase chain/domain
MFPPGKRQKQVKNPRFLRKKEAMYPDPSKLFDLNGACLCRERLRREGKRVVLTNGCFDLFHVGHVVALENARKCGDSLWIALNSDRSVRALKGDLRPIFGEQIRAYVLSSLEAIDGIFIFQGERLDREILAFKPDVYAKSGDYAMDRLDPLELSAIQKIGATIRFVPFVDGFSSTSLIKKIATLPKN